jgi:16S rRNA (cytosine967-C5)-methyltransferase
MKIPEKAKHKPDSKPKPSAIISPARKAAFTILLAVERGQSHSDDLLRGKEVNALSSADRNLTTTLVLGVLRWQIQLDHRIQALLKRPNAKLDADILIALRLGAFQLLHLDRIPARAVLSESVELAKQAGHRFASGMVNAVLRKLVKASDLSADSLQSQLRAPSLRLFSGARVGEHELAASLASLPFRQEREKDGARSFLETPEPTMIPPTAKEIAVELALVEAHPTWMVERWIDHFGLDTARLICRHGQRQPVLTVRLASSVVEEELSATGIRLEAGELLTAVRTVVSGDVTATAAFLEGRVRLQDEGSQLVAEIASRGLNHGQGRILDACAAPGGKTLILAERNPDSRILACESSAPRLEQLRKRLAILGDRIECRLADASALTEDATFDLALADVPCSGTGTLGRNPEIRHRLTLEDLTRQSVRQRAILVAAVHAIRPGGRIVYSTCSLEPEENEQVVAAVLAEIPGALLLSLESSLNELLGEGILTASGAERLRSCLTSEGHLRLQPGTFHTDGFFIALIEKTSGAEG